VGERKVKIIESGGEGNNNESTAPNINRKLGIRIVTFVECRNKRRGEKRREQTLVAKRRAKNRNFQKIRGKGKNPFTLR